MPLTKEFGRRWYISAIHAAANQLKLEEDDRRTIMERATGVRSCKEMTTSQLHQALEAIRDFSYTQYTKLPEGHTLSPKYPSDSQQAKLVACWITAHRHKLIESHPPSHQGLEDYVWRGQKRPAIMPGAAADLLLAAPTRLLSDRITGLVQLLARNGIHHAKKTNGSA